MKNIQGFISTKLEFPTKTSRKKKRYVTFTCPKCNKIVEKTYQKASFVNLCNQCSKGMFTTKEFIEKGKKYFGDKYDYSKTVYQGKRFNVTIICPVHGEFSQKAQEHLSGNGCKKCATEVLKNKLSLVPAVWLQRLETNPLITCKNPKELKGYHSKVTLTCAKHGDFITTLGNIKKSKHICPACIRFAHNKQSKRNKFLGKPAYLYYAYLPMVDKYKLGVSVNVEDRLRTLKADEPLLLIEGSYEHLINVEHIIHTELSHYRYDGKKLIKGGSTELYSVNIIPHIRAILQKCNIECSLIR